MNVINKITKAEGREQITMFLYVISPHSFKQKSINHTNKDHFLRCPYPVKSPAAQARNFTLPI